MTISPPKVPIHSKQHCLKKKKKGKLIQSHQEFFLKLQEIEQRTGMKNIGLSEGSS